MPEKQYPIKKFKLPDWTKKMPDHANLSTKDIAPIFGCKAGSVKCMIGFGYIPEPDGKEKGIKAYKNFWSLGMLRRLESNQ